LNVGKSATSHEKPFNLKLLIISLAMPAGMIAQTVTSGLTLEEYVNDILLGSGVEAFNIQYIGDPQQIGFLEGATDFSITDGLILSSGVANGITCPDDFPFLTDAVSGDNDLLTVANSVPPLIGLDFSVNSINDVCSIEFDFIATGDTVMFDYVFSSAEYNQWEYSAFNDAFAFFLSGPDINGPYADDAINIAIVPDSDPELPITISSVNADFNRITTTSTMETCARYLVIQKRCEFQT